jgi:signal transduction histidine kinase
MPITLDVFDDGRGFDPGTVPPPSETGGYGLRAMRQRIEQLGGELSVESTPGEGTIIAAQLPLPVEIQIHPRRACDHHFRAARG